MGLEFDKKKRYETSPRTVINCHFPVNSFYLFVLETYNSTPYNEKFYITLHATSFP